MSDIFATLTHLQTKVEKIVHLYNKLEEEHFQLKEKNTQLTIIVAEQEKKIDQLEEINKNLKLARALSGKNENASDAKSKINELVREIDKCMALLNE